MAAVSPRKKLVILGSGFGAFTVIKRLKRGLYDTLVISPRNHFLFTPLLPSTTVGTIEFRSIIEPVRQSKPGLDFIQARALRLDSSPGRVVCRNAIDDRSFEVTYDLLLIGVGAVNHTFGIPGVNDHALFLKELRDARRIRQAIIDTLERASSPNIEKDELARLLHFVIVGGGPTGVEFAAELADFLENELTAAFPKLVGGVQITLVEAGRHILSGFDQEIAEYATRLFNRRRVSVLTGTRVKEVMEGRLVLDDGSAIPFGVLVWSTGNGPTDLVRSLPFRKDRLERILVDSYFRVLDTRNIFAMGDCATAENQSFPATAQVAMQEGKYVAKVLNQLGAGRTVESMAPFRYKHLGMLAYIGKHEAVADLPQTTSKGFSTWLFWRSAYLTRLVSLKNKVLVLFDWTKTIVFGRDVSRF